MTIAQLTSTQTLLFAQVAHPTPEYASYRGERWLIRSLLVQRV